MDLHASCSPHFSAKLAEQRACTRLGDCAGLDPEAPPGNPSSVGSNVGNPIKSLKFRDCL